MKRIPPPIIYFTFILLGLLMNRFYPIEWQSASLFVTLGGVLMVLALVLVTLVLREFKKAGTSFKDDTQVNALMVTGPFAYSRNPMYLSLTLLQLGLGLWLGTVWILVLLIPAIVLTTKLAIIYEERLLNEKFAEQYALYCSKVRRWF